MFGLIYYIFTVMLSFYLNCHMHGKIIIFLSIWFFYYYYYFPSNTSFNTSVLCCKIMQGKIQIGKCGEEVSKLLTYLTDLDSCNNRVAWELHAGWNPSLRDVRCDPLYYYITVCKDDFEGIRGSESWGESYAHFTDSAQVLQCTGTPSVTLLDPCSSESFKWRKYMREHRLGLRSISSRKVPWKWLERAELLAQRMG